MDALEEPPIVEAERTVKERLDNRQPNGQFGPGNVANPNGGPRKEWTMRDLLLEALEEEFNIKNKKGEVVGRNKAKKIISKKLASMAAAGDIQAIKEVNNRIDGMPKQTLETTGSINLNINDFLTKIYGVPVIDATATIRSEGDA